MTAPTARKPRRSAMSRYRPTELRRIGIVRSVPIGAYQPLLSVATPTLNAWRLGHETATRDQGVASQRGRAAVCRPVRAAERRPGRAAECQRGPEAACRLGQGEGSQQDLVVACRPGRAGDCRRVQAVGSQRGPEADSLPALAVAFARRRARTRTGATSHHGRSSYKSLKAAACATSLGGFGRPGASELGGNLQGRAGHRPIAVLHIARTDRSFSVVTSRHVSALLEQ